MLPGAGHSRGLHRRVVGVAACLALLAAVAPPTGGARAAAAEDPQLLVVSVDGLNPAALRQLGRGGAPHLWRLFDEGVGTLNARTQVEQTATLPNHTSMITGRRIKARRGGHGVFWNDDRLRPRTVQRAAGHPVSSVFTRVDAAGGSSAIYAAKAKFGLWNRSWPAAIDRSRILADADAAVMATARADLVAQDRELTFVHLGGADKAGHASGWLSAGYLAAVQRLDQLVGDVLDDAARRPELVDLTVVLTADHGGARGAKEHGAARRVANFRVPFVVWGPSIAHADLYAINPGYRDPGRRQPGLSGPQPVRNGDVANLAMDLLGLGPVPGSIFGTRGPLRVS